MSLTIHNNFKGRQTIKAAGKVEIVFDSLEDSYTFKDASEYQPFAQQIYLKINQGRLGWSGDMFAGFQSPKVGKMGSGKELPPTELSIPGKVRVSTTPANAKKVVSNKKPTAGQKKTTTTTKETTPSKKASNKKATSNEKVATKAPTKEAQTPSNLASLEHNLTDLKERLKTTPREEVEVRSEIKKAMKEVKAEMAKLQ